MSADRIQELTLPTSPAEPKRSSAGEENAAPTSEETSQAVRERSLEGLRSLWRERRFLGKCSAVGLVLATVIAFVIPKEYESTTRLMPPDPQSISGTTMLAALTARAGNGVAGMTGDLLGLKTSGALFVGILQSQTVRERLVQRFELREVYGDRLMWDAVKRLSRNTAIAEDRKSGIITITVTDRKAQRAAGLASACVEELDRLVAELSTSSAHRERIFLEGRLKAVKEDLDRASERFGQFASKNSAIDIQAQGKAMVDATARLQGELISARSELEMLKQIYTENNVRVRAARARIVELQRQLEKMGGEEAKPPADASQTGDPPYPSIRELPLLGVTYADLLRRTKIQEAVYEVLTQQYELAKVQEAKETPSVKVLDLAEVPERKSFPSRSLVIMVGTALSFGLSATWLAGKAAWEKSDAHDPRKVFALEIFSVLAGLFAKSSVGGEHPQERFWKRLRWKKVLSGKTE
jgi:uncharacterized protein involved in exopolysaccharide biosynthesis